ncbi:hypothetical protein R1flu_005049 [Riccia fluitans]|uniref:Uncharacterized protein n=1 Tax=Riccia fluitans TaxID=41844 RepID=A0ABD1YSD2_9MARC
MIMACTSPSVYALLSSSRFDPVSSVKSPSSPFASRFLNPLRLQSSKKKKKISATKLRPLRFPCPLATFPSPGVQAREGIESGSECKWKFGKDALRRGDWGRFGSSVSKYSFGSDRIQARAAVAASVIGPECGRILFMVLAACGAAGQLLEERTKWGTCFGSPTSNGDGHGFGDAGSTLKAFLFGAFGTILGTFVSFKMVGKFLGPDGWKIASCLCSSYVGGSINYAATAQVLGLTSGSTLAAGMAADNLAMAAYFGIIMSLPDDASTSNNAKKETDQKGLESDKPADPSVESIAVSLAAAAVACTAGDALASMFPSSLAGSGLALMAVVASLFNAVAGKLCGGTQSGSIPLFAGAQNMGQSLMLLFFAVVGCSTGVKQALAGGWPLFIFINILIFVHLSTILILGKFAKLPMRSILIASNANIGGPGTAAAMANSRSWPGLVRPALLVGTLGYTIGTAVGVMLGIHALRPMLKISPLAV